MQGIKLRNRKDLWKCVVQPCVRVLRRILFSLEGGFVAKETRLGILYPRLEGRKQGYSIEEPVFDKHVNTNREEGNYTVHEDPDSLTAKDGHLVLGLAWDRCTAKCTWEAAVCSHQEDTLRREERTVSSSDSLRIRSCQKQGACRDGSRSRAHSGHTRLEAGSRVCHLCHRSLCSRDCRICDRPFHICGHPSDRLFDHHDDHHDDHHGDHLCDRRVCHRVGRHYTVTPPPHPN